jgi:hypothetical protein
MKCLICLSLAFHLLMSSGCTGAPRSKTYREQGDTKVVFSEPMAQQEASKAFLNVLGFPFELVGFSFKVVGSVLVPVLELLDGRG